MYSDEIEIPVVPTEITFHYINGQSDSYTLSSFIEPGTTSQDMRQEIRRFLSENWWVLKLPEETIFINASQVLKVELKPPVINLVGEGVLPDAVRVTALRRGAR